MSSFKLNPDTVLAHMTKTPLLFLNCCIFLQLNYYTSYDIIFA